MTPGYAIAATELPATAAGLDVAALAVVHGPGWTRDAASASSSVVIAAGGAEAAPAELRNLLAAGGPPVIVERPRLRRDVVEDALVARAGAPLRMVVAECAAGPGDVRATVRDAVGWSRELVGPLALSTAHADARAASALLLTRAASVPVILRATVARLERPFLRVTAVGEVTTEVVIDELGGRTSVLTLSREGRREPPTRWETVERLTLRRALAALDGAAVHDLVDLTHDTELAEQVLAGTASAP